MEPGEEEARARFVAGRIAFGEGRYEDALADFTRAYELSGKPELLYNIGHTADRLRHDEEALEAFERFLELMPEHEARDEVERRVAVLRVEVDQERRRRVEERPAARESMP
jgi:tetratricopeptide (TPR) repeat protein